MIPPCPRAVLPSFYGIRPSAQKHRRGPPLGEGLGRGGCRPTPVRRAFAVQPPAGRHPPRPPPRTTFLPHRPDGPPSFRLWARGAIKSPPRPTSRYIMSGRPPPRGRFGEPKFPVTVTGGLVGGGGVVFFFFLSFLSPRHNRPSLLGLSSPPGPRDGGFLAQGARRGRPSPPGIQG